MTNVLFKTILIALFAVIVHSSYCVIEYDDDDFDKQVESNIQNGKTTLVMFYAPWCGHCKKLKPEYEKACSDLFEENVHNVVLAKVDCTSGGKDTCNHYGVSGYPTLKIFKRDINKPEEYQGERIAEGIKKRIKRIASDDINEISSKSAFEDLLKNSKESLIVGVFKSETHLKKNFKNMAETFKEKYIFVSTTPEIVSNLHSNLDNDVLIIYPRHMHSKFEPNYIQYNAKNYESLKEFIKKKIYGLIGHRTPENENDFNMPTIIAYYDVDYVRNPKGTNYWRNRIYKGVSNYINNSASKYQYTVAISSKDDFKYELNDLNINITDINKDPIVVVRTKAGSNFLLSEFTIPALEQFLLDIDADKMEPVIKSEAIPKNNDGPLLIGVAKNFDDIVFNGKKDSLIKFYAPWCGHCKKLAPVIEELAEKLKEENVNIVKFDATANFVNPKFEVRGYPTLYWVTKAGKIKQYDGGRELNDFIKFIAKEATDELTKYDRNGKPKKSEL